MKASGMKTVMALDPGRNLGFALVDFRGHLLQGKVITLEALEVLEVPTGAMVVVGDGTGSGLVQEVLRRRGLAFRVIDEERTSLEARQLYFRDHRPRGLARLLPPGLRSPPRPIDDYAAYAIALRYLQEDRHH